MDGSRRVPVWLRYALACMVLWGLWGILAKAAAGRMPAGDEQVLFTLGSVPVALAAWWRLGGKLELDRVGAGLGVLNGVCSAVGLVAYYGAMARGPASIVGSVTALFPLLTVLLAAAFLRERINRIQAAGVVLALAAIVLLSS